MNKKLISLSLITSFTLLFTACGGGGATSSKYGSSGKSQYNISGRVINSYIKNATVFFDFNGNLELDEGEFSVKTDDYGRYKLNLDKKNFDKAKSRQRNLIVLGDGINTFTGKTFTTKLMATPESESISKLIYITPISTFRSAIAGHISKGGFGIGFNKLDDTVNKILGVDASKYVNYIKDNNLEYYKKAQIIQKIVEISDSSYEEITKKLQNSSIDNLDDLIEELDNKENLKKVKTFYNNLTEEEIKTKKVAIANEVSKKVANNSYAFDDIDKNNLEKDNFEDVDDYEIIQVIEKPIEKKGTLYSRYNKKATIFLDTNRNLKLDSNEPKVLTDENGNFSIKVEEKAIDDRISLVAINGKNDKDVISKDILFQTLMKEGNITINAFTSFQTATGLAIVNTLTPKDIFMTNFTEGIIKSLDIDIDVIKNSDIKENDLETFKKSLKIKAIVRAIANTYDETKDFGRNTLDAYMYFSSNIVAPTDENQYEFGFDKLVNRFIENNPIEKDGETFKALLDDIVSKYNNASFEDLKSEFLQQEIEKLIEDAKKFRIKNKIAQALEYKFSEETKLPKDQFSKYQWHLKDQGAVINTFDIRSTGNGDLGVDELYEKGIVGKDVHVRVVDDGIESSHEDLKARIDVQNSYNAATKQNDPTPITIEDSHGTQVAGLIAADGSNDIGLRGVAPYATLSGYKLRTPSAGSIDYNIEELTEAWLGGSDKVSIVNNSWGSTADKSYESEDILKKGATEKRILNGKALGRIYLIASGNGGFNQGEVDNRVDDSVTSYLRNSQYAITVAAVRNENIITQYSAQGSNVFVSGYGGGVKTRTSALLTTTTRTGHSKSTWKEDAKKAYTFGFDGTSAATPVTAGSLALVMGECPNLSYRDVKWLIAHTAKKIDENYNGTTISGVPNVPSFKTTPEKDLYQGFGYIKNAAGLSHSNYYGFGLINPTGMIEKCKNGFVSLPAKKTIKVSNDNTSLRNLYENNQRLTEKIRINESEIQEDNKLDKIEWVGLTLYADIKNLQKVSMVLISPSGTKSRILTNSKTALNEIMKIEEGYRFSSVAFMGEKPYGEWTLLVQSDDENEEGKFFKIELEIVGHKGE